jgi:hypothetical protein
VLATLTTVTAVMIVVVLVYCAGTRCRRGQLNIYDTPYNYHLPPLPSHLQETVYDTISNGSRDDVPNQPLAHTQTQSESKSPDNKSDGEIIAANRCLINSPFSDESGKATNDIAISQFSSTNPDTAWLSSIGTDSPSEKANLPLNLAFDDRADDEFGIIPSPNDAKNISYQPTCSTRFSLERNPAYGTDIAIAPEIEITQNIAYEYSNSTIIIIASPLLTHIMQPGSSNVGSIH